MSKLNDLNGKQWIKFTKSWFFARGKQRNKEVIKHPAKYPEELVDGFVEFFTKKGETVFDPFLGVGSTIVSAERNNRKGCGIEINKKFYNICLKRCSKNAVIYNGDTRKLISKIPNRSVDFIISSPPYWDMLSKKRGNSASQHGDRSIKGLALTYSNLKNDLSNIKNYDLFLEEITKIYIECSKKIIDHKYMVIVVQNFRNDDGDYVTYAWDLVQKLKKYWKFCGEKIWLQDDKKLGIWGYPSSFVPNIHHHYCLVFKRK